MARTLDAHSGDGLGDGGNALVLVLPSDRLHTPELPRPEDEFTVLFGVQATGRPGDAAGASRMREANESLCALATAAGGGPYAAGSALTR